MSNKPTYINLDLSEQQILDCSSSYGNNGCNGGWMEHVYKYQIAYGNTIEATYPYTQSAGNCKVNGGGYKIASYAGGSLAGDCAALTAMVVGRPVSVAVSAGNSYWQSYAGGIITKCGSGVDHGVLLVGVYQNGTENYWKVKNSWGPGWGENGFIRIDRSGSGNLCDICSYGFYPTL
jgi:hypothetical protein